MKPKVEPTQNGIEIIDQIQRCRYQLRTDESVTFESVPNDQIQFPIGTVAQFTANSLELPTTERVLVREPDGVMLAEVRPDDQTELPPDEYTLDISGPVKVYVHVDSPVHIYSDGEQTHVNFDDETTVILGARSFHERPAGTITTTTEPTDVMTAVSAFGSALKTTTPERSYPTVRGHPPRLELGDELHIPDEFEQMETGIRIEVPETLRHVFVVAPLAYYLGANVVPGTSPQLVTEAGYTYSLDGADGFESTVERVLRQLFFLDCVVRTEGTTPLPLHEREVVEPVLEFDFASAYDQSLADRLETYLGVPYTTLEPSLPDWQLETQLEPTRENVEFLPFVANDLAIVKVQEESADIAPPDPIAERAIEEFTRGDFVRSARSRSVRGNETTATSTDAPQIPTVQQSWIGIDDSEILSTAPLSAYQHSIGRTPKDGPIDIDVVCNDLDMREELERVNGTYGTREKLPFDTDVHYDLSTAALEDVLAGESDFFHYIGHIDEEGFQCSNGKLDAATVDTVGAKAFLLNACQSHDQGLHLVEAGSIGGIVTLGNVINSGAVDVGSLIARSLNLGFPLYGALDIARQESVVGQQYLMVGDGRTTIAQSETRIPNACPVNRKNDGFTVDLILYTSAEIRRGSVFSPYLDPVEFYYVLPQKTEPIPVTESQLEEFFNEGQFPVILDGAVQWSENLLTTDF